MLFHSSSPAKFISPHRCVPLLQRNKVVFCSSNFFVCFSALTDGRSLSWRNKAWHSIEIAWFINGMNHPKFSTPVVRPKLIWEGWQWNYDLGSDRGKRRSWVLPAWIQNCLTYIPSLFYCPALQLNNTEETASTERDIYYFSYKSIYPECWGYIKNIKSISLSLSLSSQKHLCWIAVHRDM